MKGLALLFFIVFFIGCTGKYHLNIYTDPPREVEVYIDNELHGKTKEDGSLKIHSYERSIFDKPMILIMNQGLNLGSFRLQYEYTFVEDTIKTNVKKYNIRKEASDRYYDVTFRVPQKIEPKEKITVKPKEETIEKPSTAKIDKHDEIVKVSIKKTKDVQIKKKRKLVPKKIDLSTIGKAITSKKLYFESKIKGYWQFNSKYDAYLLKKPSIYIVFDNGERNRVEDWGNSTLYVKILEIKDSSLRFYKVGIIKNGKIARKLWVSGNDIKSAKKLTKDQAFYLKKREENKKKRYSRLAKKMGLKFNETYSYPEWFDKCGENEIGKGGTYKPLKYSTDGNGRNIDAFMKYSSSSYPKWEMTYYKNYDITMMVQISKYKSMEYINILKLCKGENINLDKEQ